MVREQELRRKEAERLNENRRRAALVASSAVSDALLDTVNQSVVEIFNNQRALDVEAKQLHAQTSRMVKQTAQWVAAVEKFNLALKELGDVDTWARTIENDMRSIASTLEYVHSDAGSQAQAR
eukprot:a842044_354.p1 GENE.a842044_354~~a842044_354.p1  ORF type:complete len:138 (+),score=61.95 a842044_354:48-416(+)